MNFININLIHPREKLLQPAVDILDTYPDVSFQYGRFFITREDFDSHVNFIAFHIWKINIFCEFVKNNIDIVINKGFICGDFKVFLNILNTDFVYMLPFDPKANFKKMCSNLPFEFLLMFNLLENMHVKILMCPCYKDNFISEKNVSIKHLMIKHLINFHCKCPEEHEYFVIFWKYHPFGKSVRPIRDYTGTDITRCFCNIVFATEICQFCTTVRYILHFTTYKYCLKDSDSV